MGTEAASVRLGGRCLLPSMGQNGSRGLSSLPGSAITHSQPKASLCEEQRQEVKEVENHSQFLRTWGSEPVQCGGVGLPPRQLSVTIPSRPESSFQ